VTKVVVQTILAFQVTLCQIMVALAGIKLQVSVNLLRTYQELYK